MCEPICTKDGCWHDAFYNIFSTASTGAELKRFACEKHLKDVVAQWGAVRVTNRRTKEEVPASFFSTVEEESLAFSSEEEFDEEVRQVYYYTAEIPGIYEMLEDPSEARDSENNLFELGIMEQLIAIHWHPEEAPYPDEVEYRGPDSFDHEVYRVIQDTYRYGDGTIVPNIVDIVGEEEHALLNSDNEDLNASEQLVMLHHYPEEAMGYGEKVILDGDIERVTEARDAIMGAFRWSSTAEGGEYWYDVYEKLNKMIKDLEEE